MFALPWLNRLHYQCSIGTTKAEAPTFLPQPIEQIQRHKEVTPNQLKQKVQSVKDQHKYQRKSSIGLTLNVQPV